MNKYAVLTILIMGLGAMLWMQPSEKFEGLVVGTNNEFAPFSFDKEGQTVGFDIDVAKHVCERLDKKMVLKNMPFEALLPSLVLGDVDFAAAGFTATAERSKQVLFTKPYLNEDPLVIVTPKDVSEPNLKVSRVTVNDGFTADEYLESQGVAQLIRLPTVADSILALQSKRADCYVTALNPIKSFLQSEAGKGFTYKVIEGTSENCALAIPKQKSELLQKIQTVLDQMEEDGTLQIIKNKWGV